MSEVRGQKWEARNRVGANLCVCPSEDGEQNHRATSKELGNQETENRGQVVVSGRQEDGGQKIPHSILVKPETFIVNSAFAR